jgi:propionyl-CoA carboxylase alpha chain
MLPALLAVGAVIGRTAANRAAHVDGQLGTDGEAGSDWVLELDGQQHRVTVSANGKGARVLVEGEAHVVETLGRVPPFGVVEARVNGAPIAVQVDRRGTGFRLTHHGRQHMMRLLTPRAAELQRLMLPKVAPDLSRYLLCPMPGLVVSIAVSAGDRVEAGQVLATVEAMKMENILRAEKAATVLKLHASAGESLAVDAVILEFE